MKPIKALVYLFLLVFLSKPLTASSCKENGAQKPDSSPARIRRLKHYEITHKNHPPTEEDANKKAQIEAAASVLDASRKKTGIPIKCFTFDPLERMETPSNSSQSSSEEIPTLQLDTITPFTTTNITANNIQQIIVVESATPTSPLSNQTSARDSLSLSGSLNAEREISSSPAQNNSPRLMQAPHFCSKLPKRVYDRQEEIKHMWDKANPVKPYFYYLPKTDQKP